MKFCAFLRGVNVKGTNMKMADVCNVFAEAGMADVSSVLASGNILFSSDKPATELKEILEKAMSAHFSYDAFLFLKTAEEVASIFKKNPFTKDENLHSYAFVGSDGIEEILFQEFKNSTKTDHERGELVDKILYWQVPKGDTLGSSFGKVLGIKALKDKITSRNINTLEKILKKF